MKNTLTSNEGKSFSTIADYENNETREEFIKNQIDAGFEVVYPQDNELQIDIDTQEQYRQFIQELFPILERELNGVIMKQTISKGGLPGRHIYIRLPFKIDTFTRIALQASVGSDPKRELLSSIQALNDDKKPTLLIEVKK